MAARIRVAAVVIAVACGVACGGGDGSPRMPDPAAGANQKPLIEQLRLEPAEPVPGDNLRALVRARDPDGQAVEIRFDWEVGGVPRSQTGPQIEVPRVRKGTRIEVTATASDGLAESEPARRAVEVRNQRPTLTQARIEPWKTVGRGESLSVRAEGTDPDGDRLTLHYRWRVNDQPVEAEGDSLSTAGLAPGDLVYARVVASDGASESDPIDTARVRVVGATPKIVSEPGEFSTDGTFRYTVEVEQPHGGGDLRFRLRTAPEGMWLNPVSGEIIWRPEPGQTGVHPVEVEVQTPEGVVIIQAFRVNVGKGAPLSSPPANQAPE
jgi:hypothetical protein